MQYQILDSPVALTDTEAQGCMYNVHGTLMSETQDRSGYGPGSALDLQDCNLPHALIASLWEGFAAPLFSRPVTALWQRAHVHMMDVSSRSTKAQGMPKAVPFPWASPACLCSVLFWTVLLQT